MGLRSLDVQNLRCIEQATLELDSRCNVIYGDNAAGKTTVLEAIFLLGCGRSFRSSRTESLIRTSQREFQLLGRLEGVQESVLGFRGSLEGKEIKLDGTGVKSFADLALALPVQAIDPEVHKLLEEGPARRRRFLDWGVFHVEPVFRAAWKRYHRALHQRNAALRARVFDQAELWNQELVESGTTVSQCRESYVSQLVVYVHALGRRLLDADVDVSHVCGWRSQNDFGTALNEARYRDQSRGSTTVGPHHADLVVRVDGIKAKDRVSRGQQKMLAAALFLAQQTHRIALGASPACLLVDDPAAELDGDNLGKLLEAISAIPAQLVVTSLRADVLKSHLPAKLFHVEHGKVALVA